MTKISREHIPWGVVSIVKRANFRIAVVDEANHGIDLTPYGRRMNGGSSKGGTAVRVTLGPGEAITEELFLDQEYEVNKTGTYQIQAERFDSLSNFSVKSNVIVLKVE